MQYACHASLVLSLDLKSYDTCNRLVSTHGTTRLSQITSESLCFQWIQWTPSDYFPTPLLSKNLKILFTLSVPSYDQTSVNSNQLHCTFDLIFSTRLHWNLGFVYWNLVGVLHMCAHITLFGNNVLSHLLHECNLLVQGPKITYNYCLSRRF